MTCFAQAKSLDPSGLGVGGGGLIYKVAMLFPANSKAGPCVQQGESIRTQLVFHSPFPLPEGKVSCDSVRLGFPKA